MPLHVHPPAADHIKYRPYPPLIILVNPSILAFPVTLPAAAIHPLSHLAASSGWTPTLLFACVHPLAGSCCRLPSDYFSDTSATATQPCVLPTTIVDTVDRSVQHRWKQQWSSAPTAASPLRGMNTSKGTSSLVRRRLAKALWGRMHMTDRSL